MPVVTDLPTHSVAARLAMLASVCRRRLSSSVALHGGAYAT